MRTADYFCPVKIEYFPGVIAVCFNPLNCIPGIDTQISARKTVPVDTGIEDTIVISGRGTPTRWCCEVYPISVSSGVLVFDFYNKRFGKWKGAIGVDRWSTATAIDGNDSIWFGYGTWCGPYCTIYSAREVIEKFKNIISFNLNVNCLGIAVVGVKDFNFGGWKRLF